MARNSDCDVDGFAKELGPTIIIIFLDGDRLNSDGDIPDDWLVDGPRLVIFLGDRLNGGGGDGDMGNGSLDPVNMVEVDVGECGDSTRSAEPMTFAVALPRSRCCWAIFQQINENTELNWASHLTFFLKPATV